MIILIRSNDIVSDPRAMKYVNFYQAESIQYRLIGWDREGSFNLARHAYYYKNKAGYNIGGFKAALNRLKWFIFVITTLRKHNKKEPITIHACDLDSAFPAVVYKKFFNKSIKIIFDIFDWYSATLYNQHPIILQSFKYMERIAIQSVDHIILCEPERKEQIPYSIDKNKISILPNIPNFSDRSFLFTDPQYKFNNSIITFAYVGGLVHERCIDEIIELATKGHINLLIAGYGDEKYKKKLLNLSNYPNIKYFGKVEYKTGLNIMYNADIIYAMYETTNPNHIYAAPNKYYEAMFLGKPIFTTKGTIVERKVNQNNIGYVSHASIQAISNAIDSITRESITLLGNNALHLWNTKYRLYTKRYLDTTYRNMIV